jgi:hypothetical protein
MTNKERLESIEKDIYCDKYSPKEQVDWLINDRDIIQELVEITE